MTHLHKFFVDLIVWVQTLLTAPTKLGVFSSQTLLTAPTKLGETPLNFDDPPFFIFRYTNSY